MILYSFSLCRNGILIAFSVEKLGDDLCVTVTGGDQPHIGSVALSIARPSLRKDGTNSASTSILTLVGHKDDIVAKYVAEYLSTSMNKNVVAVCGIHYNNIDSGDIDIVLELVGEGARKVCDLLSLAKL
jgi:hypothetical protein